MTEEKRELEQESENTSPVSEEEAAEAKEPEAVVEEVSAEQAAETPELKSDSPTAPVEESAQEAAPVEESAQEAAPVAEAPPVEPPKEEQPQPVGKAEERKGQVDYSDTFKGLSRGDVVDGVVVHIDKEGVLVDVGMKSEGIIRPGELSTGRVESPEDVVSVGDQIKVYVMQPEDGEGNLLLSKKRADFEKAWERVQQAFDEGKVVTAMVTERVKGGLQVDLGIRGFVPGSHVGSGKVLNLDRFVGQSLPLRVLEIDRERRKVVLSHRLAMEEQRTKQREVTISSLTEGQIRQGTVRRITDYGAFIDLGGVDGLLHISEMSWTRITHPSTVVKVGQKVNVMILKLDPKNERISLGLRQILPDPWTEVEGKYRIGDVIQGAISRLVPFGAFVQLPEGIEAIIPNTELSHKKVRRPEDVISVGQTVEVKVIDLRPEERRMTLSLRQLQEKEPPQTRQSEGYQSSGFNGRMTLGDLVGDKLQGLVSQVPEKEPEATEAEPPAEEPKPKPKRARTSKKAAAKADAEAQSEPEPASTEPEIAETPAEDAAAPDKAEGESS